MASSSTTFEEAIRQMLVDGVPAAEFYAQCIAAAARHQPSVSSALAATASLVNQLAADHHPGGLEQLGTTKRIFFIVDGPLINQGPFSPGELASVLFKYGTTTVYALNAPCRSGKSPSLAYLTLKAKDEGCWVLLLLNIVNNQAITGLAETFRAIYKKLDIAAAMKVVTDDIFLKRGEKDLQYQCDQLKDPNSHVVWICRADQGNLEKLLASIPAEAWSRCVVMLDEVHCFFTLQPKCTKKAELNLIEILFGKDGGARDKDLDSVATMRVRSLVVSDATDADVPHVLQHFKCGSTDFRRICADAELLKARSYVSASDFELFVGKQGRPPMAAPFSMKQRYGKDARQQFPCKERKDSSKSAAPLARPQESEADPYGSSSSSRNSSTGSSKGKEFAQSVTKQDFDPLLLDFFEDAMNHSFAHPTFLMEIITNDKSEDTDNSVEHHAQAVARIYPGVQCLAQHGGGCWNVREDGSKQKFQNLEEAYNVLQAPVDSKYHGKPKYLCTNLGNGGMQYAHPGSPITHIHIGFTAKDTDNLLVKGQGLGRACGFVQADLDLCGGKVQVLCTQKDFDSMRTGLPSYMTEAFAQYPNHIQGIYTTRAPSEYALGHANNPMTKAARKKATVPAKDTVPNSAVPSNLQNSNASGSGGGSRAGGSSSRDVDDQDASASEGEGEGEEAVPGSTARLASLRVRTPANVEAIRAAFYNSKESKVAVQLGPERALVRPHGSITISEAATFNSAIRDTYPGVQLTSKVIFLKGNDRQQLQGFKVATDKTCRPTQTDFAAAVKAHQASILQHFAPHMAFISTQRSGAGSSVAEQRFNRNPAWFGKRGQENSQVPYNTLWAYDVLAKQAVAIVRTVQYEKLQLPFIYHKMVTSADGSVDICAMLVSETLSGHEHAKKRTRKP